MNTCKKDNAFVFFLKNIFAVPDSYRNLVNTFGKADAYIAIVLFLLYCVAMALSGILVNYVSADAFSVQNGGLSYVILGFDYKCTIYAGLLYYTPCFIFYKGEIRLLIWCNYSALDFGLGI